MSCCPSRTCSPHQAGIYVGASNLKFFHSTACTPHCCMWSRVVVKNPHHYTFMSSNPIHLEHHWLLHLFQCKFRHWNYNYYQSLLASMVAHFQLENTWWQALLGGLRQLNSSSLLMQSSRLAMLANASSFMQQQESCWGVVEWEQLQCCHQLYFQANPRPNWVLKLHQFDFCCLCPKCW